MNEVLTVAFVFQLKAQLEEMVGRGGKVGHPDDEVVTVSFLQRR